MKRFVAARGSTAGIGLGLALLALLVAGSLVPVFGLLFGPRRLAYQLTETELVVEATIAGVSVGGGRWDRAALTEASAEPLSASPVRHAGTGLPNLCAGRWGLPDGRSASLATTCTLDVVVMSFGSEWVVISPEDPTAFVAALRSPDGRHQSELQPATGSVLFTVLGGLLFLTLAGVVAVLAWLPRAIRTLGYTVRDGQLEVPAHFRPVTLPLAGATARQGPLTGVFRAAGTALPGVLYLGHYRGNGVWVHCAATNLERGWFVSREGAKPVYVTPEDDAGFAAALEAAGAKVERAGS